MVFLFLQFGEDKIKSEKHGQSRECHRLISVASAPGRVNELCT
jgi:hypothetical protein